MVKEPTESKEPPVKLRSAASPTTTLTLPPAYRPARAAAAAGSTSCAVSRCTRCRSHSVAAPGPGPISSMAAPRSACRVRDGRISSWMWAAHSGLVHTLA